MADGDLVTTPFGEWRPDVALLDNEFVSIAENVFPGVNAYLPMLATQAISGATSLGTGNDGLVVSMMHFDGADAATSSADSSVGGTTRKTWTFAGNAQLDTADKKFGASSLLCDGTGDWVSTPDHADFDILTNKFCVDFWFKINAASASDGTILRLCGQADAALTNAGSSWYIYRDTNNKITATVCHSINQAASIISTTSFTNANAAWNHVKLERTGTTITLKINNVAEGGGATIGIAVVGSSDVLAVGTTGAVTTNPHNGWIDEFRFTIGDDRSSDTLPTALYDSCRGLFMARDTTGLNVFFAGTAIKLYKATQSNPAWTDVSRSSGGYYNLAPGDLWSFAQFGDNVYATHVSDVLQSIDATSGTNFAATSGSPPQASHVATVGDFLVLSGLSTNKRKLQWSAINDPTGWTVGTSLSDEQTMPDGGDIRGIVGDTVGLVVQDRAIRAMQFLPGDTDRIFAFSKVESERGAIGKAALCYTNNTLFMRSSSGFNAWNGGIDPFGQDRFNNWFLTDQAVTTQTLDIARWPQMVAFAAPNSSLILFAWYFEATAGGLPVSKNYDRLLIWDYHTGKGTYSTEDAQMWGVLSDTNGVKRIGCVDTTGKLALLYNSSPLAATLETCERHLTPGARSLVTQAYPVIRATTATVTITPYTREELNDTSTAGTAASPDAGTGWAQVFSSARLHKFRVGISAANWTSAQGVMVDYQPDGEL